MSRILLLLDHKENRHLLAGWMAAYYHVLLPNQDSPKPETHSPSRATELDVLSQDFDLCILDGRALKRLWEHVQARKTAQQPPVFLPFLLLAYRQDIGLATRHLWHSVDELIIAPIERVELQARVEILLRTRQLTLTLKAANEHLQELNYLKSRFISMACHEFRNPLSTILNSTQLLQHYSNQLTEDKRLEYLNHIQASVHELNQLLNDVLIIGKAEIVNLPFNPAPLDLEKFCHDVVKEMQLGAGDKHTIAFVSLGDCAQACLDQKLLRHILINLLGNAVKYSPQGGTIRFDLACEQGEAIFRIQDNGIGIPAVDQENLFNSFHRGSNVGNIPGTGLGLVIVKQYVDLHNGEIAVASKVGVGTTFIVTLPLKCARR